MVEQNATRGLLRAALIESAGRRQARTCKNSEGTVIYREQNAPYPRRNTDYSYTVMKLSQFLPVAIATLCFALPSSAWSRDRDRDDRRRDHGRREWRDRDHDHDRHRHHHNYRYSRYPYSRYGYGYPYGYGYGYGYPYSGFGLSFTSRPSYYHSSRVYRGRTASGYSDSLAAEVQQELRRRGYYRGAIDGDIGPASRAAIRRYQAQRGLAVTGRIDSTLLRALGVG